MRDIIKYVTSLKDSPLRKISPDAVIKIAPPRNHYPILETGLEAMKFCLLLKSSNDTTQWRLKLLKWVSIGLRLIVIRSSHRAPELVAESAMPVTWINYRRVVELRKDSRMHRIHRWDRQGAMITSKTAMTAMMRRLKVTRDYCYLNRIR